MKCIKCNNELDDNGNYCFYCGEETAKGYMNNKYNGIVLNDKHNKKDNLLIVLSTILFIEIIGFITFSILQGENMYKPYSYIKKKSLSLIYGYDISLIKTDNKYDNEINDIDNAKEMIKYDFEKQYKNCFNDKNVRNIETNIETNYDILSVLLCDMDLEYAKRIENVITNFYNLFPNSKGYLTNITITNAKKDENYIARFQPMYEFVNNYNNKVIKTQILLNSYYFLNKKYYDKMLNNVSFNSYYVKDATLESTIAHELGHYLVYVSLLKQNNYNFIYVNNSNNTEYENVKKVINTNEYTDKLLSEAINRYNEMNNNISNKEFASMISKYASEIDINGNINSEEVIAEAIHDYYLHGNSCSIASKYIVNVIKEKL